MTMSGVTTSILCNLLDMMRFALFLLLHLISEFFLSTV